MISGFTKLALSVGLSLSLGFAFTPLGCGGKQKVVDYATADDLTVPDEVKEQLTDCVKRGAGRLSDTHYAIMFDVQADDDGDVRSVEIHDSILGDWAIESCMRRALQGMTLPSAIRAMRSSRADGEGVVAPGSRALVGNPLVLGGATVALGPVVIVAAGVTVLVAVTIYILSEASKDDDDTKLTARIYWSGVLAMHHNQSGTGTTLAGASSAMRAFESANAMVHGQTTNARSNGRDKAHDRSDAQWSPRKVSHEVARTVISRLLKSIRVQGAPKWSALPAASVRGCKIHMKTGSSTS